jgi:FMN phosphatase YigB (HAD superfamily)
MVDILRFEPKEILFIDDSDANLSTAQNLGIKCMKYENEKSIDKIREFLKNDRERKSTKTN